MKEKICFAVITYNTLRHDKAVP